jgi:hypothetical protein
MEKFLFNPIVLGAFGIAMAIGLLIIGITIILFRFLRKRIAQDILGMPAPGGPDTETWPYRSVGQNQGLPLQCPWPCQEHKGMIDRIGGVEGELNTVEGRQKVLREETLPEKYPTRREHEACQSDRKKHEGELFSRVGKLEQKIGN